MEKQRRYFICTVIDEEEMRRIVAAKFKLPADASLDEILEKGKLVVTPIIES